MASLNKVMIIGRLGQDPQTNHTQSGTACANLSIATDEGYKDQYGNKIDKTEWHRVTCWQKLAELVAKYLHKGSMVYVEGKLQTRKWQDKTGADRYTTEIVAREVKFLDSKNSQAQPTAQGGFQPAENQPQPQQADMITEKQVTAIYAIAQSGNVDAKRFATAIIGAPVSSMKQLTKNQGIAVINALTDQQQTAQPPDDAPF